MAADANNDGAIDIPDGIAVLGFLFLGASAPVPPGSVGVPCGPDPDPPGSSWDLGCDEYGACGELREMEE